ncbi:asparagine synthetase B [Elizabethkingia meningoseptica]|uniref:asparagine synthase B n=1 Tax=Elizabethkingia meningoseptica TaxID=238 RepID=UPI000332BF34|nr:asparagine synthase B [Elizabethkingia meningoseptica]AQX06653.1 asparagine synthase B [Elizabethkingia meningoseptica]AQX48701.1 asparagine synthase B [Elizabethkingia meningoseptica]EOR28552.1 asparagine synthetase B [Elizabethkingia meningoseptica ATCC 13253 = NBRC 12535]KUY22378.1 asparagine synthetase B [Elizabethkingia meningoseptica]MCL1674343.1 asparagine synthase B [Elizabethkingia meningoseptica]
MCGIVCLFDAKQKTETLRPQVLEMSKKIRHRGPDWSGIFQDEKVIFSHERLAIVDPTSGKQPLFSKDGNLVLAVNGEIYNHLELRKEFPEYDFLTQSDCEVILALYQKYGKNFLEKLNGIFAFALYDIEKGTYLISRDHMGIIPLYRGWDTHGNFYVASELKALEGICNKIEEFKPGHLLYSEDGEEYQQWYARDWESFDAVKDNPTAIAALRKGLEDAVHRQLMSDVPYGVLLSGGLDSTIIAAITAKFASKRIESGDTQEAWYPRLHSFAVGLEGSPDLAAARKAADHIGSVHHEIKYTIQEGLDAIRDVIYHLETYDVTTIRASTPMYLLARVIKSMGIKMVLSGEGSDELFGGYLYFHKAPNAQAFHEENVRKLGKLHLYDCLRANKSLMAWGIEGRVPFLDKEFMDIAMTINPQDKMVTPERMEKWVLRKAFEDILPESIAWRQKEQFSDGVGYGWIDTLKQIAEDEVSDEMMANAKYRFPINTPMSKEEYRYRSIFSELFPSDGAAQTVPSVPSVACSTPVALEWDEAFKKMNDPSGRAVKVHEVSY